LLLFYDTSVIDDYYLLIFYYNNANNGLFYSLDFDFLENFDLIDLLAEILDLLDLLADLVTDFKIDLFTAFSFLCFANISLNLSPILF